MVVRRLTEFLCGLDHVESVLGSEAPVAGRRARRRAPRDAAAGPFVRQHRCQGGTGARGSGAGGLRRWSGSLIDAGTPARSGARRVRVFPPAGPGRPRSRPFSWVTGLLSPAVRSLPWSEVPRRTARSVRLIAPASHAWFFRARAWLARAPGPTKRPAGRSRAVRVRGDAHVRPGARVRRRASGAGAGGQILPRHSSSRVIASAVPGLPRASL